MSTPPTLPPNPTVLPSELWRWVHRSLEDEQLEYRIDKTGQHLVVFLRRDGVREMSLLITSRVDHNRIIDDSLARELSSWISKIDKMLASNDDACINKLHVNKEIVLGFDITDGTPFLWVGKSHCTVIRIRYTPRRRELFHELTFVLRGFYATDKI